jgi:hypothetical protein
MELTGLYLSPSIQGSYDLNHIWAIHTGIRWNFALRSYEKSVIYWK